VTHRHVPSLIKTFLLLIPLLLLRHLPIQAVEPGDAYLGLFGGYQKGVFAPDEETRYAGLKNSIYQPTLNYGDYRFDAIGFYRNDDVEDEQGLELGLVSLFIDDFWLTTDQRLNAFVGDNYFRENIPTIVFEHFTLPGQTLRGGGGAIDRGHLFAGIQGGRFTEPDFIIPDSVSTTEDGITGAFIGWDTSSGPTVSWNLNVIDEEDDRRFLTSFYMNHPMREDQLRLACWHDSQSESIAAAFGVIRESDTGYFEAGLVHVPEDFNYISRRSPLPQGQSQLFGTYRHRGVRYSYTLEGSGGTFEQQDKRRPFFRGSLNGFYRLGLEQFLGGGLNGSFLEGPNDAARYNFQQNLRYSVQRRQWDTTAQFQALQFIEQPGNGDFEKNQTLRWIGNLFANYRFEGWQAGVDLSVQHTTRNLAEDSTAVVLKLDGRVLTALGMDLTGFVQGGATFADNARDELFGFGVDLGIPVFGDYYLRFRTRMQRNLFSRDFDFPDAPDFESASTSIDLFAIFERRYFWGSSTPVYGHYSGFEPNGVGVLAGRVFVDENGNRRYDSGETTLKNAILRMDDGFVVETRRDGTYRFPNVAAGTHHLILDEASFSIRYVSPHPEGRRVTIEPRRETFVEWPLQLRAGNLLSPKIR
jgi:hypothetical protein